MSHKREIILYKLEGPAFQDGLSLYELNIALIEIQMILEKSYLTLLKKQKLTKKDRELFKLISRKFEKGSLLTEIEIVLFAGSQILMPIITSITPRDIWELTKNTFDFLKLLFKLKKENKSVEINIGENNSNVTILVMNDNSKINFNGPVNICAVNSLPHYKNLTKLLEEDTIDKIEATNSDNTDKGADILLTKDDKSLFSIPELTEEIPQILEVEIFNFDKYKNNGKLRVLSNQSISEGEYPFTIAGEKDLFKYIYSMTKDRVKIHAYVDYREDILTGKRISTLKIVEVEI